MNPELFLTIAGPFLIMFGLLGIVGILGRISLLGFFNPPYWINWAHLCVGLFALGVLLWGSDTLRAGVTAIPAVLGLVLGVSGLLFGRGAAKRFNMPELADISDHIAHLTVGSLALWAVMSVR